MDLTNEEKIGFPILERNAPFMPTCNVRANPDINDSK